LKDSFRAEVGPNFGVSTHTAYLIIFLSVFVYGKVGLKTRFYRGNQQQCIKSAHPT
jgi:hypothetical protein